MHYGLAYEANSARLSYYTTGTPPTASAIMSTTTGANYPSNVTTNSPEAGSVPLPYHHIHPTITTLNGTSPGHHHAHIPTLPHPHHPHPYHPNPVLQYSPQPGTIPYSSFVPSVTQTAAVAAMASNGSNNTSGNSPVISESETPNRQGALKRAHHTPPPQPPPSTQTGNTSNGNSTSSIHANNNGEHGSNNRTSCSNNRNNSNSGGHDGGEDSNMDDRSSKKKRVNHGHHLPPPPSSTTYHHPRASTFTYPPTMFGTGGYTMASELGTVVPVSSYYSGHHQVLSTVPAYHPAQIGHHFHHPQNKLSLFDHEMETSDLEQSNSPNDDVNSSSLITLGSSSSNFFKYSHSALTTLPNQYYSLPSQTLDIERYSRKSPQSTTSDYGSGTSSPPSLSSSSLSSFAFDKLRKETSVDCSEPLIVSSGDTENIQAQVYHPLRNWNNYSIYTDLSASRPLRKESLNLSESLKVFPNQVYDPRFNSSALIDTNMPSTNASASSTSFDSRLLYHPHHQAYPEYALSSSSPSELNSPPNLVAGSNNHHSNGHLNVPSNVLDKSSSSVTTTFSQQTRRSQSKDGEKSR